MPFRSKAKAVSVFSSLCGLLIAGTLGWGCAPQGNSDSASEPTAASQPSEQAELTVGAIPDQDPEKLQRLYGILADYLSAELGVSVNYEPVTNYTAAVTAFRVGDLDLVWFGGLTGVQARLQVPDAESSAQ